VTRLGVDRAGALDLEQLRAALRPDTGLISLMLANNETGVIFPIREVCQIAAERGVPVHTDAVNALGKIAVDVEELGVSLLSLSGHKIYGPKGVGALYIRRGTPFQACQVGGSQERRRRGGTLNTPGIAGLGEACRILLEEGPGINARTATLRQRLERELIAMTDVRIAGYDGPRLPNTSCVCFAGVSGEALLMLLSEAGVCASGGAACASGSLEASHVLKAMQVPHELALGQVRFSLGRYNTDEDLDRLFDILPRVLPRVAASSLGHK
jgi:cysteine desulfurase